MADNLDEAAAAVLLRGLSQWAAAVTEAFRPMQMQLHQVGVAFGRLVEDQRLRQTQETMAGLRLLLTSDAARHRPGDPEW